MQFRALGVLIHPKLSSMITRKILLRKLLLKKVSLAIDITTSLYLLNITKEGMTVLHSLLHLGKKGERHLLCFTADVGRLHQRGPSAYRLLLCFPAQFLTPWPEQAVHQVRQQKVCLTGGKRKEWVTGNQVVCMILQDVNFALLLRITYNFASVIHCGWSGDGQGLLHGW